MFAAYSMERFLIIASLLLAGPLHAQVRELWRSGLTNSSVLCGSSFPWLCDMPFADYTTTIAAVDGDGNTLVGGVSIRSDNSFDRASFVAKFDGRGNKSWEYNIPTKTYAGVEGLASDAEGNVFISTRMTYEEPRPLVLIKLDPDGNELWRIAEFGASAGFGGIPQSTIRVDSQGNAFLLGLTSSPDTSGGFVWNHFLDKFSPDGGLLWRVALPDGNYYVGGDFGFSKSLALLADGSAVVIGVQLSSDGFQGVVAKFSTAGKLQWLRQSDRGNFDSDGFSNVIPGPFGTILVGGSDSAAVFSRKGRLIRGINPGYSCEVLGVFPNGSFLVNQSAGQYMLAYGPSGRERWKLDTLMNKRFGFIQRGNQWIAVGIFAPFPDQLRFLCLDSKGNTPWETSVPGYLPDFSIDERLSSVLTAPDGTVRVVMNRLHRRANKGVGVAVSSFAIELQPRLLEKPFLTFRGGSM